MAVKKAPKLKWFMGLLGSRQDAAVVVAKSGAHAIRILDRAGYRVTAGELRNYWNKTEPRAYENMSLDSSPGVYLSKGPNWPRNYEPRYQEPLP